MPFFFVFIFRIEMFYYFVGLVKVLFLCQVRCASLKIVDLTHTVGPDSLHWPGEPAFVLTKHFDGFDEEHGFWLAFSIVIKLHLHQHVTLKLP